MSLYIVVMRGWLLFGDSEAWLRLPSVIFAAACVPDVLTTRPSGCRPIASR